MANRPVYEVSLDESLYKCHNVDFVFYSGFSESQQRKSVKSLHGAFLQMKKNSKILEISSKSEKDIGKKLSAFNLSFVTKKGIKITVESAFQASKVFENGGPYRDLLLVSSKNAKKDLRLKNSGHIISFKFDKRVFPIEPKTYFYNWLYINILNLHSDLSKQILEYDAFTDISFNPKRSVNCQAEAAAIYVSLYKQNLLKEALINEKAFLEIVYRNRMRR